MTERAMAQLTKALDNIVDRHGPTNMRSESILYMFAVLSEEVGEVATVLQDPIETKFNDLMIEELAQVAAVAMTMIDMIYARPNRDPYRNGASK